MIVCKPLPDYTASRMIFGRTRETARKDGEYQSHTPLFLPCRCRLRRLRMLNYRILNGEAGVPGAQVGKILTPVRRHGACRES